MKGTSSVWQATVLNYFLGFLKKELGINAKASLGNIELTLANSNICKCLAVFCIYLGADYLFIIFLTNFLFFKLFFYE